MSSAPAPRLNAPSPDLLNGLRALLGPKGYVEPEQGAAFLEEPRDRYPARAALIVRPDSSEQVAEIVKRCFAAWVGIVPRSGGTGLVGGQSLSEGPLPILLSLDRLNRLRKVDPIDNVIIAEAGCLLADIQSAAAAVDRLFPLSMASEGSCRIGGNLATNAGGINVLRYGNARDLCLGVEAVMADGSLLHALSPLRKDNTGYDLRHLLIGSEGTLGIITAASLKLVPQPGESATALCAVTSPAAAVSLLRLTQEHLGESISAFELLNQQSVGFVTEHIEGMHCPLDPVPPWMVLIEAAQPQARTLLEAALAEAFEKELIGDAVLSENEGQRQRLWHLREAIPLANRAVGSIASHDIAVPISRLAEFIDDTRAQLWAQAPDIRIPPFGHLGDGNLHFNLFPAPGRTAADYAECKPKLTRIVHDQVHRCGGSISAEHGIGRAKVSELERYADPVKLASLRAIKTAMDPRGILNPGAVLSS
ncbi:MAG: FAD-binding oxidoreductase [Neomegalonema sp.]|nr:FAD-binding oxidoreductase [Neomegalonema sp.]